MPNHTPGTFSARCATTASNPVAPAGIDAGGGGKSYTVTGVAAWSTVTRMALAAVKASRCASCCWITAGSVGSGPGARSAAGRA